MFGGLLIMPIPLVQKARQNCRKTNGASNDTERNVPDGVTNKAYQWIPESTRLSLLPPINFIAEIVI